MLPASFNAAYLSVGLLCCDLQGRWERVAVKTVSKGLWLSPSAGLWVCKHQPVRVIAVPVTIKRNPSVLGTSHAGTASLLQVVLVFSFYICHP